MQMGSKHEVFPFAYVEEGKGTTCPRLTLIANKLSDRAAIETAFPSLTGRLKFP
jgi:hypothetical protein